MQLTPQQCTIGMKVRYWKPDWIYTRRIHNQICTIIQFSRWAQNRFLVKFDAYALELWVPLQELRLLKLTPEEQDQANREAFAEKYL